ncbi:hypothetical protein M011DRAFT_460262 [Sporormia fimetaria CBS 119925]|uniref:Uncharacterized protein n=1 Tax=Sporormia fimetaria CBS 119925 TaxID=1340428 RepID=A0A6A6V440_9PLEO|nr:hypothetical protein M011DRAFT_460262 [Sporormia fimetaria CBS 119925]
MICASFEDHPMYIRLVGFNVVLLAEMFALRRGQNHFHLGGSQHQIFQSAAASSCLTHLVLLAHLHLGINTACSLNTNERSALTANVAAVPSSNVPVWDLRTASCPGSALRLVQGPAKLP